MRTSTSARTPGTLRAALLAVGVLPLAAAAALTDIADAPLSTSSTTAVKPNLLYVLDDSGSMGADSLPDHAGSPWTAYRSAAFNGLAYNPAVTYRPAVNADGTSRGAQGSPWTAVVNDSYATPVTTVNLAGGASANHTEQIFCNRSTAPRVCKRQGIDNLFGGTAFALDAPPGPTFTGVTFSRIGITITGQTGAAHGFSVGDTITVTGAGGCSAGVAVVTSTPTATRFTYDFGSTFTPACATGSVRRAVTGFPENDTSKYSPSFTTTGAPNGTAGGVVNSALGVVTVTHTNHRFVVGDYITVTGGGAACNASAVQVTAATADTFTYSVATSANCSGTYTITRNLYNSITTQNTTPYYFEIVPVEHCRDDTLIECVAATSPSGDYVFPAPVRFCNTAAQAVSAPPVSTTITGDTFPAPRACQGLRADNSNGGSITYTNARFGLFRRVNILPATSTYAGSVRANRKDCASKPTCTYAEEMTNYGNWFTYYRTRMQMMKTVSGLAFVGLPDSLRVGFTTINPGSPVTAAKYLAISDFNATQKSAFFTLFYSQTTPGGTPLAAALSRAGRHFAGKTDGINNGMTGDPVQYACQRNYTLLTTDGFSGDSGGTRIDGTANVGNQDNSETATAPGDVNSTAGAIATRASGRFDGNCGTNCSGTLGDIALYYWANDLRTTIDNRVPTTAKDPSYWQNMTTFTLGMANGLMRWRQDYDTASEGDFANIKAGAVGKCLWTTGTCNWPIPFGAGAGQYAKLDDLWHAAVNGRGKFYQALDPKALADGLDSALLEIQAVQASESASTTSSAIIVPGSNVIYSAGYTTGTWVGKLEALTVNTSTGVVDSTPVWSSAPTLDGTVSASSDTRTIYTFDNTVAGKLKPFSFASLSAAEKNVFRNACLPTSNLTQCPTLDSSDLAVANDGEALVNFLRGHRGREGTLFRTRANVQGDAVNAEPVYVKAPLMSYTDAVTPTYADFAATQASRAPVVYLGSNDGMLHAFNAAVPGTGAELWAYVPRMLWSRLPRLADTQYRSKHRFYVDGTPTVADVYMGGAWRTVLVGGLNAGGRGYYALDITNPTSPTALWEFCHDSSVCAVSDADLGLSFGNPVVTKRASDGKWVVLVTSGHNNVSPGDGKGYLYVLDLATGTVLSKTSTGVGSTTTPSGLAKIAAWNDDPAQDNTTQWVYGGDLQGNVWRFSLATVTPTVLKLAELKSATGVSQPITTRPELTSIKGSRMLFFGTGAYLGASDLAVTATQSVYAFKDTIDPGAATGFGDIRSSGVLVQQTVSSVDANTRTISANAVNLNTKTGWYFDLPTAGERVDVDPQLALGTLIIAGNVPQSTVCTVGGQSWLYFINYLTGSYVLTSPGNTAATRNASALVSGFNVVRLGSAGPLKAIVKYTQGQETVTPPVGPNALFGRRMGWRELTR